MKERNDFLDMVIEQVRLVGKPNDRPVAFIKNEKNELIITLIISENKEQIKIALYNLMKKTKSKEIVLVQTAYFTTTEKGKIPKSLPSEDTNRKEAFIISYFTKDKTQLAILEYEDVNNDCICGESRKMKTKITIEIDTDFKKVETKNLSDDIDMDDSDDYTEDVENDFHRAVYDYIETKLTDNDDFESEILDNMSEYDDWLPKDVDEFSKLGNIAIRISSEKEKKDD